MAPTTTTARETAHRQLPWRFVTALIACTFLWGVASVAAIASAAQGQSQTTASSQKPADKTAATPTQKPKNRFGAVDEEEQQPAAKPVAATPAQKPKNRFGAVDKEEQPAATPAAATSTQKPKNRFGGVYQEEQPATRPAAATSTPKPRNRFGAVEEEKPAAAPAPQKPRNRFASVGEEEKPAPRTTTPKTASPKPANRFATVDEPAARPKPATAATGQAAPAPAAAVSQPVPAAPSAPAAQPAPPKNRFATVEPEEEQQKPADPQAGGEQKAAPKNRFALEEDEEAAPPKEKVFTYTGTRKCSRCHMKQLNAYRNGPHGRHWDDRTPAADLGCETCHGPGQAHDDFPAEKDLVRTFTRISPREASAFCLKCHDKDKHTEWSSGLHEARNVTCINCHTIHQPKSEKGLLKETDVVTTCAPCHRDKAARIQRSGHMPLREGKMDCASCHNVHGSTNVKLLKTGATVNEACLKCHADKRGPFLWEHAPVAENCTTCHDPHGSWNDRMLVAKSAMLCERCHIGTRHPSTAYDGAALAARNNRLVNRGCVNCHSMIHGSNHPSGRFLAR